MANCYTALDLGVEVVPVLNKMDLPQADPERARAEIEDVIGIDADDAIPCSAKTGEGIDDILEAVVQRMPAPRGRPDGPLRAMIIDSWFDNYVGVVMLVRVVDGALATRRAHPPDGERRRLRRRAARRLHARSPLPRERLCGGRGRLRHRRHQGAAGSQGRRHHHAREEAAEQRRRGHRGASRASRRSSRRSSPASTRPRRASTTSCATRSKSSSSTTRRCATSPR